MLIAPSISDPGDDARGCEGAPILCYCCYYCYYYYYYYCYYYYYRCYY